MAAPTKDLSRKGRIEESREMEISDAQIRRRLQMDWHDPLHIDPQDIPEGMQYAWLTDSLFGQPDIGNMQAMYAKGFKPVPRSRHPHLVPNDEGFGRENPMKGYIVYKGAILCERLKEYAELERKTLERKNIRMLTSMPGTENFLNDPTMPGKIHHNETSYVKTGGANTYF